MLALLEKLRPRIKTLDDYLLYRFKLKESCSQKWYVRGTVLLTRPHPQQRAGDTKVEPPLFQVSPMFIEQEVIVPPGIHREHIKSYILQHIRVDREFGQNQSTRFVVGRESEAQPLSITWMKTICK